MSVKANLKFILMGLLLPLVISLSACEENEVVDRDFTLNELHVISKQWCSEVMIGYGSPHNMGIDTLVKLDLTGTGYIHINTVTTPPQVSPPIRQSNSLSCFLAAQENSMECYGVGIIKLDFKQDIGILNIDLISETNEFTECTTAQLMKFR